MISLCSKEIKYLIQSGLALLVISVFFMACTAFLWIFPDTSYFTYGYADSELFFGFANYFLVFVIPILTVGFFSKEYDQGTIELLQVIPYSCWQIVGAKFLAGLSFVTLLVLLSAIVPFVLQQVSDDGYMDRSQLIGSMLGLYLVSSVLIAISLFCSAVFVSSSIALLSAIVVGFILFSGFSFVATLPFLSADFAFLLERMGLQYHVDYLSKGIISMFSLVYNLSLIYIFLYATQLVVKLKK